MTVAAGRCIEGRYRNSLKEEECFAKLSYPLQTHGTGALVVSAMLDFLTFALCNPYSETTDGSHFDRLLQMVADNGRSLYRLFQHPSLAIVKVEA